MNFFSKKRKRNFFKAEVRKKQREKSIVIVRKIGELEINIPEIRFWNKFDFKLSKK